MFASERVDLTKPVTTLCYSGVTATVMALAAAHAGKTDAAVYAVSVSIKNITHYIDKCCTVKEPDGSTCQGQ